MTSSEQYQASALHHSSTFRIRFVTGDKQSASKSRTICYNQHTGGSHRQSGPCPGLHVDLCVDWLDVYERHKESSVSMSHAIRTRLTTSYKLDVPETSITDVAWSQSWLITDLHTDADSLMVGDNNCMSIQFAYETWVTVSVSP